MLAGFTAWLRRWARPRRGDLYPGAGNADAPRPYPPSAQSPGQVPVPGHRSQQGGSRAAHRRGAPGPGGTPWPPPSVPPPPWPVPGRPGPVAPGADPRFTPAPPPGRPPADRPHTAAPRSQRPAASPAPAPRSAAQPAAPGDAAWRPAGQAADIGGYTIPGGLVYAGSGLAAEKREMPEPALSTRACRSTRGPPTTLAPRWATGRPTPASRLTAGPPTFTGFSTGGVPPARTSDTSSCTSTAWNGACSSTRSGRRRPGPSTPRWSGKSSDCCGSTGRTARSVVTPATCSASCPWAAVPGGTCPRRQNSRKDGSCRSSSASASASSRPMLGRCPPHGPWPGSASTRPPGCGRRRNAAPGSSTNCSPAATASASTTA